MGSMLSGFLVTDFCELSAIVILGFISVPIVRCVTEMLALNALDLCEINAI